MTLVLHWMPGRQSTFVCVNNRKWNIKALRGNFPAVLIDGHLKLTEEVAAPQRLTDLKITGKQSLVDAIERADQVVYVTHHHHLNVPTKTSVFENVVKIMGEKFPEKRVRAAKSDRLCHSFGVRPHQ